MQVKIKTIVESFYFLDFDLSHFRSRNLPSCVFVLSLLYIRRLRAAQSSPLSDSLLKIDRLTSKELYLIATLVADKYLIDEGEDDQLFNSEISQMTGIRAQRINFIERQLLMALNWNLFVSNEEIDQLVSSLKRAMTKRLLKEKENNDRLQQYYELLSRYFPQIFEYLAVTSLFLVGSTISILTAIHFASVTQSTLMASLNPPVSCLHLRQFHLLKQNKKFISLFSIFLAVIHPTNETLFVSSPITLFHLENRQAINETTRDDESPLTRKKYFDVSSCSFDALRLNSISRSRIETVG